VLEVPRPVASRCDPAREDYALILAAHEAAVRRGESSYRDPSTGWAVMTAATLSERGQCCAGGCRHCPYV
jgi:hypothetical protein